MNTLLVFILGIIFGAALLFIALEVRERREARGAKAFFEHQGKLLSEAIAKRPKLEPLPSNLDPLERERQLAIMTERTAKLEVQLAGCSVAALGSSKKVAEKGDYGWSQSYQDVFELRKKYDQLLDDAAKAGLGKASEN